MPVELRPLGVGEIFDRAVTLYVRNFAPFATIAAFVAIPSAILKFWLARAEVNNWQTMIDVLQGKHPDTGGVTASMAGGYYLSILFDVVFLAFMYVTVGLLVAQLYEGRAVSWRESAATVLHRFGTVLAATVGQIAAMFICAFAGMMAIFVLAFAGGMLLRTSLPLGIAVLVFAAICGLALIGVLLLCYLWSTFIYDAVGVERLRFVQAAAISWERIFNVREVWKALLIVLAIVAVQVGIAIVMMVGASLIIGLLKSPLPISALEAVVQAISESFLGVLVAVYYFDVRIRTEGLDMQADLDRLELQPQS